MNGIGDHDVGPVDHHHPEPRPARGGFFIHRHDAAQRLSAAVPDALAGDPAPAVRGAALGVAGVVCVVLALDYHRSEELYSSLELQQRAGKNTRVTIPTREASEISALSAFDLYANLMSSRTLAPDGLFLGYKLEIAEREERILELHGLFASSEVLRDGAKVKELKTELDQHSAALPSLYEHWEEATEMN